MSSKKPYMELGARLKIVRTKLGLKQPEMADKLGIATSTYQYYERGERDTPSSVLLKLTTYGVNPSWLVTGENKVNLSEDSNTEVVELQHVEIIKGFEDKELARDTNMDLRDIESINRMRFRETCSYIKGVANTLRSTRASQDDEDKSRNGQKRSNMGR